MHTIEDQMLSPGQVTQLTLAMLSVAAVDGIHPAEAALIGQFYESSRTGDMPTTATFMVDSESHVFDVSTLNASASDFVDTLMLMCLMTAHADGSFSATERVHMQGMAKALGVDDVRFEAHLAHVRDDLVGALSHLPDAQSVAMVSKGLSQDK